MEAHPATALFPLMGDEELGKLAADIRERGLLVPIATLDGQILDGRNRLRACEMAGVTPRFESWNGNGSPAAWVISINLRRRHLTADQRAAVAAEALPMLEAEAAQNQQMQRYQSADQPVCQKIDTQVGRSTAKAAEQFDVNRQYISDAKRVRLEAPELHEQVKAGTLALKDAKRELRAREKEIERATPKPPLSDVLPPEIVLTVADAARLPLADQSIDLIVTSPPYGLGKDYGTADEAGEWEGLMGVWLCEMYRVSKIGGRLAINVPLDTNKGGNRPTYAQTVQAALSAGWTYESTIVWNEGNVSRRTAWGSWMSPGDPSIIAPVETIALFARAAWHREPPAGVSSDMSAGEFKTWTNGLWTFNGEGRAWEDHPAAFPEELPRRLIKLLSFPGDTILDLFLGSGTAALLAHRLGRRFYGFDLNADYVESAKRRLAAEAGQ